MNEREKMAENSLKWNKWIDVFQTITLVILLPWATWVTRSQFLHERTSAEQRKDIDAIREWQNARPKFVTVSDQTVAIMQSEDRMRQERDTLFKAIQTDLKELLKNQQEIRIDLLKHAAGPNGNGKTPP